jgi:5'-phosphate synthase pdxT subunit
MARFSDLKIGVLALQGDFERHQHQLVSLGVDVTLVRLPVDLENIDGLIVPGGESTTMDNLIDRFHLRDPLTKIGQAKPVWGTCAGMIMLGKAIVDNQAEVQPLGLMDIDVVRTGYSRQVFSFEENITARLNDKETVLKATFIRAPVIKRIGKNVKALAYYHDTPVLVIENNLMASSFHTELDDDTTLLRFFLSKFF